MSTLHMPIHDYYYTYNQTILGFCAPPSQMQVKDESYSFITQILKF